MNTAELDSYRLADAVKFNKQLNPRLWQGDRMLPQVREKLLEIAADFKQSLGLSDLEVKDITVSGSNAGFTYTPHSDIDLHLVVDIPQADVSDVYRELFDAKKYQYNAEHNITIGGHDVELYVENANVPPVSQGVYSLMQDDWINIPKRRRSTVDDDAVRSKYADIKHRIQQALDSKDHDQISAMAAKIKKMRTAGLAQSGELGPENLAYKMLRTQGLIKQLYDARTAARDLELSLNERKKKKKQVRYAYGGYWAPGFSFGDGGGDGGGGGESIQEVSVTPDGVSPSTKMFLEQDSVKDTDILKSFAQYVKQELGIKNMPKIRLKRSAEWAEQNGSFGQYVPELNELTLSLHGRHIVDVLRTLAHELTHAHQQQTTGIPDNGGDTGSEFENEANARAGEFMRHFADAHPEYFDSRPLEEGLISRAGAAAALAAAMAMTPAQAQEYLPQDQQQQVQQQGRLGLMQILNIAKTVYAVQHNVTRAGAEAEIEQELRNYLRAQQGDAGAQNQSRVWQLQQRQKQQQQPAQQPWTGNQYQREDLAEASGYIPTDAEKNDPRFVMALSPDVRPGATGKNANRMALKTDSQGRPQIARANGLVESLAREFEQFDESTALFEIKMTGKNLSKLASDIKDVKVGLEFEMIVPNNEVDVVEPEMEPDWDQDQRARSFSDVRDFFDDGDYNSRRSVNDLIEELSGEYEEWKQEQTAEQWERDGVDYMRDFVEVNDLFDREEAIDTARDEVINANPDLPPESKDFQDLLRARLDELQEQFVLESFEDQGRIYNDAFETFAEEQNEEYDERSFFDDRYQTMSDIQSNFDIAWPYYYDINYGQTETETDIKRIALEFMNESGLPYNNIAIANSYHGRYELWDGEKWVDYGEEKPDFCFTIEPDGSLRGDDDGDAGLEFVSPPILLDQVSNTMSKVQQWAGLNGVYTGKTNKTSMHTNISIPGYDLDKLDYVKAALLLGDEYVLREFDRIGNSYAAPAIEKVRELVKQKPDKAKQLLDKMKSQLNAAASKLIHSGSTEKFTSINTKDNRIEFRSPGGDYLSIIADNPQKMVDTINRMVVAMDAAMDPDKYKEEYQKKLYKMLTGQQSGREAKTGAKQEMKDSDKDLLNIFSRYAAGELPKQALKSFVRQAQLERNVEKGKVKGKMWWSVSRPGYFASIEVVANSKEEAIDKALEPGNYPSWASARNTLQATPLRSYQEEPKSPTLNGRPSNPDGNFIIVRAQNQTVPVYRYMASDGADSLTVLRQWIAANPGQQWTFRRDTNKEFGQPGAATGSSTSSTQDNWGIWIVSSNRFARQPNTIVADNVLRRFPSQAAAMAFLERTREENPQMRTDVEVREIEPSTVTTQEPGGNGSPAYTMTRPAEPANRNTLTPTGPGPWEVFRRSDNSSVAELGQTNRMSAEVEARRVIDQRGEAPELYGVRTVTTNNTDNWSSDFERRMQAGTAQRSSYELYRRADGRAVTAPSGNTIIFQATDPDDAANKIARYVADFNLPGHPTDYDVRSVLQPAQQDAAQGGIVDIAGEQPAAPQTLTRPGQGQQQWTGEWLILDPNDRVIHRFGGIGNVQADANRIAMDWLRRNPRHMQAGVTVVPEMQ